MAEPPSSGAFHASSATEPTSVPVAPGARANVGSTGSKAANIRLPPDCRVIVALAVKEFGGPPTHPPMHPSSQPTSTRPSLSMEASKKSSMLRQVPPPQMGPRWIGSPGVTFCVVHVWPPSNVVAMKRYQIPVKVLGSSPFGPPL